MSVLVKYHSQPQEKTKKTRKSEEQPLYKNQTFQKKLSNLSYQIGHPSL